MNTQPMFDADQRKYLSGFMTETQLKHLDVIGATGHEPAILAILSGTRLTAPDKAMVVESIKEWLATAPKAEPVVAPVAGFPGTKAKPFAAAPVATAFAAVPTATLSLAEQVANLLTVVGRDGTRYEKGLAKVYRDNPALWPTVDPFGRPFPSLQAIVTTMTKEQARTFFTGKGYPRVVLDGIGYYIQDKAGHSATKLMQQQQQQHVLQNQEDALAAAEQRMPRPIVIDMTQVPNDIQAGDWRTWNERRGTGARYEVPARHVQLCAQLGIYPHEYEALAGNGRPVQTAPATTAPKARKARKV